jgi:hypothetical protein
VAIHDSFADWILTRVNMETTGTDHEDRYRGDRTILDNQFTLVSSTVSAAIIKHDYEKLTKPVIMN